MTDIKLNRLIIENFKKISSMNLVLNGRNISIYGDNAAGKTTIFDAFTWALFSKDSLGNGEKNVEIKPLDSHGKVKDHQAITSVEVEFSVNDEIFTFRRTYREIWTTRRGTGVPVYEGNTSDYFVNGIPCKKNSYDAAIKELVSEDLFRILTKPTYFSAEMKWQEKRAILFDMAGTLTDKEIMASNSQFAELLDSLGKHSLVEYKTKLLHERKGQTGVRDDTPTRINECQRTLAEITGIDFAAARTEEQELTAKRDGIQVQIMAMEQDAVLEKKRLELREAKFERSQLERRNDVHRDAQRKNGRDLSYLHNEISREKARVESNRNFLRGVKSSISRFDKEIQNSRDEYVKVNTLGGKHILEFVIMTESVSFHLYDGVDGASFGKFSEEPHVVDIASHMTMRVRGNLEVLGQEWNNLGFASGIIESVYDCGRKEDSGCHYMVREGCHVYAAFNGAFRYTGTAMVINGAAIAEKYRPDRTVYSLCPVNDRGIALVSIKPDGYIRVEWVQILIDTVLTGSTEVTWIDGYLDYWV